MAADLPPALQAKLAKRGIIQSQPGTTTKGHDACPNLVNPYHECTDYCTERRGLSKPNATSLPQDDSASGLPPEWQKVLDDSTQHYYYWNTKTNEVSWYPPPKAMPSSAQNVKQQGAKRPRKPNFKRYKKPSTCYI
jgi:polyglutamine-binding protein 1